MWLWVVVGVVDEVLVVVVVVKVVVVVVVVDEVVVVVVVVVQPQNRSAPGNPCCPTPLSPSLSPYRVCQA